jgi:hypothetical protein
MGSTNLYNSQSYYTQGRNDPLVAPEGHHHEAWAISSPDTTMDVNNLRPTNAPRARSTGRWNLSVINYNQPNKYWKG